MVKASQSMGFAERYTSARQDARTLTKERHTSPRLTDDQLSGTPDRRDAVDRLARLYCELGTATFDYADGRLLSGQYHARRAALCTEIRRHLAGMPERKGTAHV